MSQAPAVAAVLACAAGFLLPGGRSGSALDRLDVRRDQPRSNAAVEPLRVVCAAGAAVAALAVVGAGTVVVGAVAVLAAHTWLRRRRARSLAAARRAVVAELLDALVGELRSGADPPAALASAARGLPGMDPVVQAAGRPSGDVAGALAVLAARPGGATAADLAVAWRVAELTGCALAAPVERLLEMHRGEDRLRSEVAAQLAGPVATGYLLSALPLAGLAMGVALGTDPVGFLTGTGPGLACLGAGVALVLLGMRWTRSITASVTVDWTGAGP